MLRTFCSNPSLGGFGYNESSSSVSLSGTTTTAVSRGSKTIPSSSSLLSTTNSNSMDVVVSPDAFCQIIKELVDNAVDACCCCSSSSSSSSNSNNNKRVRVMIEPFHTTTTNTKIKKNGNNNDNDYDTTNDEIYKVTVTDNGCGMNNIQQCVGAFHSNKNNIHYSNNTTNNNKNVTTTTTNNKNVTTTTVQQQQYPTTTTTTTNTNIIEPTMGRYGIGLTLCILHAQRLVPNSCTCIVTATCTDVQYTCTTIIVDTDNDTIHCIPTITNNTNTNTSFQQQQQQQPIVRMKKTPNESGTSISILVPGGRTAILAWPRLVEYFARFTLSLHISCSIEVLAPTLCRIPIYIHPITTITKSSTTKLSTTKSSSLSIMSIIEPSTIHQCTNNKDDDDDTNNDNELWTDSSSKISSKISLSLSSQNVISPSSHQEHVPKNYISRTTIGSNSGTNDSISCSSSSNNDDERKRIWKATQSYLGRSIDLANVAHICVPIRTTTTTATTTTAAAAAKATTDSSKRSAATMQQEKKTTTVSKKKDSMTLRPRMVVNVIVVGGNDDDNNNNINDVDEYVTLNEGDDIPTLTKTNNNINNNSNNNNKCARMILIRMVNKIPLLDSAESSACGLVHAIASKKRLWNTFGLDVSMNINSINPGSTPPTFDVRDSDQLSHFFHQGAHNLLEFDNNDDDESDIDKGRSPRRLLPAAVRLGNILIIVQIHAEPSTLPLPTLCKGRLPIGNKAIDDALEVGITQCLQQLQKSNPNLLLKSAELRKVERDSRYVPAISMALASIVSNSKFDTSGAMFDRIRHWDNEGSTNVPAVQPGDVQTMSLLIERRLRFVLTRHSNKEKCNIDNVENTGGKENVNDIKCANQDIKPTRQQQKSVEIISKGSDRSNAVKKQRTKRDNVDEWW